MTPDDLAKHGLRVTPLEFVGDKAETLFGNYLVDSGWKDLANRVRWWAWCLSPDETDSFYVWQYGTRAENEADAKAAAQADHAARICAAIEPIAPLADADLIADDTALFGEGYLDAPDVAQAARVLLDARWPQSLTAVHAWMKTTDTTAYGFSTSVEAALRAIADGGAS